MSTCYVITRRSPEINRQQFLEAVDGTEYVSDEDIEKGLTIQTATDIGFGTPGDYAWASFCNDVLNGFSIYGGNRSEYLEMLADRLGITVVSEHDERYPRESFPVDVNKFCPYAKKDGWEVHLGDDDFGYLYDRTNDQYYSYISRSKEEINIDEMIEEATE